MPGCCASTPAPSSMPCRRRRTCCARGAATPAGRRAADDAEAETARGSGVRTSTVPAPATRARKDLRRVPGSWCGPHGQIAQGSISRRPTRSRRHEDIRRRSRSGYARARRLYFGVPNGCSTGAASRWSCSGSSSARSGCFMETPATSSAADWSLPLPNKAQSTAPIRITRTRTKAETERHEQVGGGDLQGTHAAAAAR